MTIVDVGLEGGMAYANGLRVWFDVMMAPVFGELIQRYRRGGERVSANLYMLWSGWLDEYDVAASERVFRTLASVLPAGSVEPVWGEDWPRLVKDDASRHR